MIKGLVASTFGKLGYEILPRWRLEAFAQGEETKRLFQHFAITTVIDVGGHRGGFRDFLRHYLGFEGMIHSFEPAPDAIAELQERAKSDPNWRIHPFALGAAPGKLMLNTFSMEALNSFKTPTGFVFDDLGSRQGKPVEVDVKTLDEVAGDWPDLETTFVKIDTQGFEHEVIAGGTRVFARIPLAQAEISMFPIYVGAPDFYASLRLFGEKGLQLADIFTIGKMADLRAREFDCLFVRSQGGDAR